VVVYTCNLNYPGADVGGSQSKALMKHDLKNKAKRTEGMTHVEQRLPSKCKVLSSTLKNKKGQICMRGVTQSWSACLLCTRPWVQSLLLQKPQPPKTHLAMSLLCLILLKSSPFLKDKIHPQGH
jgi:hypothetical protein